MYIAIEDGDLMLSSHHRYVGSNSTIRLDCFFHYISTEFIPKGVLYSLMDKNPSTGVWEVQWYLAVESQEIYNKDFTPKEYDSDEERLKDFFDLHQFVRLWFGEDSVQKFNLGECAYHNLIAANGPFEVYLQDYNVGQYLSNHHVYIERESPISGPNWRYDCLAHNDYAESFGQHIMYSILYREESRATALGTTDWFVYGYWIPGEPGIISNDLIDYRHYGGASEEEEDQLMREDYKIHGEIINAAFNNESYNGSKSREAFNIYEVSQGIAGLDCDFFRSKKDFDLFYAGDFETLDGMVSGIMMSSTGVKFFETEETKLGYTYFRVDRLKPVNLEYNSIARRNYVYAVTGVNVYEATTDHELDYQILFLVSDLRGETRYWYPSGSNYLPAVEASELGNMAVKLFDEHEAPYLFNLALYRQQGREHKYGYINCDGQFDTYFDGEFTSGSTLQLRMLRSETSFFGENRSTLFRVDRMICPDHSDFKGDTFYAILSQEEISGGTWKWCPAVYMNASKKRAFNVGSGAITEVEWTDAQDKILDDINKIFYPKDVVLNILKEDLKDPNSELRELIIEIVSNNNVD